jgi:hypothetical protein
MANLIIIMMCITGIILFSTIIYLYDLLEDSPGLPPLENNSHQSRKEKNI